MTLAKKHLALPILEQLTGILYNDRSLEFPLLTLITGRRCSSFGLQIGACKSILNTHNINWTSHYEILNMLFKNYENVWAV